MLVAVAAFVTAFSSAFGGHEKIKLALKGVPTIEMPAKAAEIVCAAAGRQRSAVTLEVVRSGLELNPALTSSLVAAISKASPDVANIAAGKAAEIDPRQAVEIALAATHAAPRKAGKIVAAVCRAVPSRYRDVAVAVAQICPSGSKEILQAVASVFPDLNEAIEISIQRSGAEAIPSVAAVLDSMKAPTAVTASAASGSSPAPSAGSPGFRGPTVAPPYVPYSSSGPNVTPSTSGTVPRGQRTYASP